jgi:hypothetical protein
MPFVAADFDPPGSLVTDRFVLEPLDVEHNESDYEAWSSSIPHIRATPGFEGRWPHEMTLEENRRDLERHADDFAARRGFTYTVLDPATREVIGCVYIYPTRTAAPTLPSARGSVQAVRSSTATCGERFRAGSASAGRSSTPRTRRTELSNSARAAA